MNRLFGKLIFLWIGNIIMWIYFGGEKSMNDVSKTDNEIIGKTLTIILGLLIYFSFF
ncbi:hypothetical protein [Flavobacterium commune]|jgi:hypothetical protein|uniref:hypothetical protein n=1 Tax=Flavobacterium commune TaxID=1306519 RepID=UPI0012FA4249|nr:hypothetical protein [Flavobacterium commune]